MTYQELLEKLYKEVKPITSSSERFEVPQIKGHVEGVKTIVTNIFQIASLLRRKPEHLIKFLSRELAALSVIEGDRVIFNRKLHSEMINRKLEEDVKIADRVIEASLAATGIFAVISPDLILV